MKVITLTTDFGLKDNFAGIMKGVISNINPSVNVIDISHSVSSFDVKEASFLIGTSYHYFPRKTIHVAVVDPGVGSKRKIVLVETNNYYFLAPDNGILSYCLKNENIKGIFDVTNKKYFLSNVSNTFHGRDIFAPVSAYLSLGVPGKCFGSKIRNIQRFKENTPLIKKSLKGIEIIGSKIYEDKFGNVITNIPRDLFAKYTKSKKAAIHIGNRIIKDISSSYIENPKNKLMAIWGSFGYLEISACEGSAAKIIKNSPVIVRILN